MYNFVEELMVCTRTPLSGGRAEPSLPLKVMPNEADDSFVRASFAGDDDSFEVPGLTVGRLKLLLNRNPNTSVGP